MWPKLLYKSIVLFGSYNSPLDTRKIETRSIECCSFQNWKINYLILYMSSNFAIKVKTKLLQKGFCNKKYHSISSSFSFVWGVIHFVSFIDCTINLHGTLEMRKGLSYVVYLATLYCFSYHWPISRKITYTIRMKIFSMPHLFIGKWYVASIWTCNFPISSGDKFTFIIWTNRSVNESLFRKKFRLWAQ